jgi:hypothetical protein
MFSFVWIRSRVLFPPLLHLPLTVEAMWSQHLRLLLDFPYLWCLERKSSVSMKEGLGELGGGIQFGLRFPDCFVSRSGR